MKLSTVVEDYCLRRDVTDLYQYQLDYAVKQLALHLGRQPTIDDLQATVISQWLRDEQRTGRLGDRSRRNIRASLITIAKAAQIPLDVELVRQVKVAQRSPEAWDFSELRQVCDAAASLPGTLGNGLPRGRYMSATLWFCFETGLRRRDVMLFDVQRFGPDRRAALTQNKTGRVHVVEITQSTYDDLHWLGDRLQVAGDPHWRTPLRWPHHWSAFYHWMARARKIAGVDAASINRALQHIRRTGATAVECEEADSATKYLGHRSGGSLAWSSYIDPRKVRRTVMPPAVRPDVRSRSESDDAACGTGNPRASSQAS